MEKLSELITNGFVGKATPHYSEAEDAVTYVQGYNITQRGVNYTGIKRVSKEFQDKQPRSCLKENDMLTIQTGEIGVSALVPPKLEGANCHALIITRFRTDIAAPDYFVQYVNSHIGLSRLLVISTGSILKHINSSDLKLWFVPLPPLLEQKKIAKILSAWDRSIDQVGKLIDAKQRLKKGLMQQLLTGRMRFPEFGKPVREKDELPVGWKIKRLGSFGSFLKGQGISNSEKTETGIPCITYGEIYTRYEFVVKDFYSFIDRSTTQKSQ